MSSSFFETPSADLLFNRPGSGTVSHRSIYLKIPWKETVQKTRLSGARPTDIIFLYSNLINRQKPAHFQYDPPETATAPEKSPALGPGHPPHLPAKESLTH